MMSDASNPPLGGLLGEYLLALARAEVDYVVCGGVACILHGVDRVTADLDLAVELSSENVGRFVDVAEQFELQPRVPVRIADLADERQRQRWINEKQARVMTLVHAKLPFQVDILLAYPIAYDQLKAHATVATYGDSRFHISSPEHLIEAKRSVQPLRKVDEHDIAELQRILRDDDSSQATT